MSEQKPPSIAPPGTPPRRVTPATSGPEAPSARVTFTPGGPIGVAGSRDQPSSSSAAPSGPATPLPSPAAAQQ
ncbi:MAG TPA: hypothetical protein PLU22_27525, partial [Polyangiaceae bacterium]|nr:hypothetical protein [Polyangiaceae bacterium]